MSKYSSYPPVTEILDDDVVLIHSDAANVENTISWENIKGSIVSQSPGSGALFSELPYTIVSRDVNGNSLFGSIVLNAPGGAGYGEIIFASSPGAVRLNWLDVFNLHNASADSTTGGNLVLRSSFGVIGGSALYVNGNYAIPGFPATGIGATLVSTNVSDLQTATSNNTASKLVKRSAIGEIVIGGLTVTTNLGSTGSASIFGDLSVGGAGLVGGNMEIDGDTNVHGSIAVGAGSVGAAGTIGAGGVISTARGVFITPGTTDGLWVNNSGSNPGKITVLMPIVFSIPINVAAPTYRFTFGMTVGFTRKADWGIFQPQNTNYVGSYVASDAANDSTHFVFEFRKIDGTNIGSVTLSAFGIVAQLEV